MYKEVLHSLCTGVRGDAAQFVHRCTYIEVLDSLCAGVRGGAAHPGDGLDEGDPGEEEVAPLVPRHHRHEQVHQQPASPVLSSGYLQSEFFYLFNGTSLVVNG